MARIPPPPETIVVDHRRVSCDGDEGALGHQRIWLQIDTRNYVECPYCDRRFQLDEAHAAGIAGKSRLQQLKAVSKV